MGVVEEGAVGKGSEPLVAGVDIMARLLADEARARGSKGGTEAWVLRNANGPKVGASKLVTETLLDGDLGGCVPRGTCWGGVRLGGLGRRGRESGGGVGEGGCWVRGGWLRWRIVGWPALV